MHLRRVLRALLTPLAGAAMAVTCFGGCHPSAPPSDGGGSVCKIDVGSPEAVRKARFGLDPRREHTVKAGLEAVASVHVLVGALETELLAACEGIARDLGATDESLRHESGPGKRVERACGVAFERVAKARSDLKSPPRVEITFPVCSVSMAELARCAAGCEGRTDQALPAASCAGGVTTGQCPGACMGTCWVEGGEICTSRCDGRCHGTCSEGFDGVCPGALEGTCDGICLGACEGVMTDGKCVGTCRGTCKGRARGVCGGTGDGTCRGACVGTCRGTCSFDGGLCGGACTGSCSSAFVDPRCTGWVELTDVDRACRTACQALGVARSACTTATVHVVVEGHSEAAFVTVLEKHLPRVLALTRGIGAKTRSLSDEANASLEQVLAMARADRSVLEATAVCLKTASMQQKDDASALTAALRTFAARNVHD